MAPAVDDPIEVPTRHGPARVHLQKVRGATAVLVLGHGAGGGVGAPDLVAASAAAQAAGVSVVLVEQPYRVAGRRSPAPAGQLDAAWIDVLTWLRGGRGEPRLRTPRGLPVVTGGRSSGARVACRTAAEVGAIAVLCLAFPVHPPGRGDDPAYSRLPELDAVAVAVLVVQGERDPFGMPPDAPGRTVVRVGGDHSLRQAAAVREAVAGWLPAVVTAAP